MEVIKENSKIVLENWVHQFSDELFSWALYKTSSKETAEDLVQETFLAAFHKIDTFQGKSQPKTWLFSILNNKVIDYYRLSAKTTKKTFSISENSGYELSDGLFNETENWKNNDINPIWDQEEELLDNPEFNIIMQDCMDDLPQKWKFAVTSKYLTDKNADEICQELEITVSNYWQIVHRAKLLLKKCLEMKWL
ncbi:MAG: sigma-70 family RNA polymerase sigma factor [Flavobacteriia bacterium]|nr:sigma-70 family RNA polymerase sigma factor [Flavobacteriia bacterium]OIP45302.1 MAG: RNA polymerase subunit sigma [Flavobacteriaceae bacterium CG2_30_31_66]PIV98025.1 MAG: RNA polymerase subunit sigma [Flavobacteriaceae bacterium CG17_big_fil_post_rev_8_21_14_2_50_31_13]PIX12918.1 MAG: RNA polymerase subunit sigma [Flavobacteriaceae bacterium CG_4_8_14_3_um_filter_31_8]PIY14121.1 MAG: RNA polymerase subunit sigma [Flavobacteriaceae bacterium CG_4_10_14_3_um_filter_31_253]PIZ10241.1 MAG: RN